MNPLATLMIAVVRAYQLLVRPLIAANCRFDPHCSAYAIEAIRTHGALRGGALAGWRVLRCNPWNEGGDDPVPPPRAHGAGCDCSVKGCKAR